MKKKENGRKRREISMRVKSAWAADSAPGPRLAWPFSSPSKKILLFFFLLFRVTSASRAQEPPKVTLERVVDGRGNRFCDVATATAKAEGVTRSARVVRGLLRDDLVLTFEVLGHSARLYAISLGGGAPLRFEASGPGGRVTVSSPLSSFRYFEHDLGLRTVRCNLARLADETDRGLLRAAADYVEQGLEDDGLAAEELPVLALAAAEKRPPPAVPPTRRSVPWTDGGAEADDLAAAARAAVAR
jgi:hypothetical protein